MIRAGVFIGVDKTGTLQQLNDAAAGARRMYEWALSQGFPDQTHAKLITDEGGKIVTPDLIYDAISTIINGPGVDQLIVYFAGHGVNINRSEHWLLTQAPGRTSAAVNVAGSEYLARYCGIGYVAIISDACRVAPEGIQAQNVRGQDIFPNDAVADKAKPVDQFFACGLGKTAAELKDPKLAATHFSALYTGALLDALHGTDEAFLETSSEAGDAARYLRPARLEAYLEREIPLRVARLRLQNKVNQNPDAILTLHSNWLARVSGPPLPGSNTRISFGTNALAPQSSGPRATARNLLRAVAHGDSAQLSQEISRSKAAASPSVRSVAGSIESIAKPFGPDHFESGCGFKIRGNRVIGHTSPWAQVQILDDGHLLRVDNLARPAASVLLKFEDGSGATVPAIKGFIAALTFDPDGELEDVTYEPSANTRRWDAYKDQAEQLRALRAVAGAASQHGRFRLTDADAPRIAQQMQYAKSIDPTFSVYAAYAYYDLHAHERLREMCGFQLDDLGVTLFDLALLSRQLMSKTIDRNSGVVPFVPLLSQGWALLSANKVKLHPLLKGLENTMRPSLWSLFDADGVRKLEQAMQSKELP
jgi:hypothetical protein